MTVFQKLRDLVRGALGVYLLEQRLVDIRNAIRATGDKGAQLQAMPTRLEANDAEIQAMRNRFDAQQAEIQAISGRIEVAEAQLADVAAKVEYGVVRDVFIALYYDFPLYLYAADALQKGLRDAPAAAGVVNLSVADALTYVERRAQERQGSALSPDAVIDDYWPKITGHDYNGIHWPLMACLMQAGVTADFIDVGANVGDTALSMAQFMARLRSPSRVISFEPGPVFELARANIALNRLGDRIEIHNKALSDVAAYLPMRVLLHHSESGSIAGIGAHYDLPLGVTRLVEAVTLEGFLAHQPGTFYLKVDAEGADFAVIRGAAALIETDRVPVMHIEITPKYMSTADRELMASLLDRYALFNLRGLDVAGFFDRFDEVTPQRFEVFMDRVTHAPHGWTDVTFIERGLLASRPFERFRDSARATAHAEIV